jgi:phage terminase large subunit GpA-like protein
MRCNSLEKREVDQTMTTVARNFAPRDHVVEGVLMDCVFSCPKTGAEIDPGIESTEADLAGPDGIRFAALYVRCPHCGEHHEIKIECETLNEAA